MIMGLDDLKYVYPHNKEMIVSRSRVEREMRDYGYDVGLMLSGSIEGRPGIDSWPNQSSWILSLLILTEIPERFRKKERESFHTRHKK